MYCLTAPALQSACSQTPRGFIYTYFHIPFLYVTTASVWQQVTKGDRFYYGHQVRWHHIKQSQFSWAAYDMHCWNNILPRVCHCSDINIFFPRLNMSRLSLLMCVHRYECVRMRVFRCVCLCVSSCFRLPENVVECYIKKSSGFLPVPR